MSQVANKIRSEIEFVQTFASFHSFDNFDAVEGQVDVLELLHPADVLDFENNVALRRKYGIKERTGTYVEIENFKLFAPFVDVFYFFNVKLVER